MAITVFVIAWLVGLFGTFVPVIPSTLLILLGAVLAGLIEGFDRLNWIWLMGLALVTVAVSFVDNIASGWGARRFGGSRQAMWGALVGGVVGIFIPFGLIVGPLVGAFLAELILVRRPLDEAARATWGTLVGLLTGMAAKFVLHFLMGAVVLWRLLT